MTRRTLPAALVVAVAFLSAALFSFTPEAEVKPAVAAIEPPPAATLATKTDMPSPSPSGTPSATPFVPDEAEVIMLAKLIYAEARGIPSTAEKAAVVWCVLNRVDDERWPDTIYEVLTQKDQFAYFPDCTLTDEFMNIAADVLTRWEREKAGAVNIGRVLPAGYCFFMGDGRHNNFTIEWKAGATWDWSAENPYTD